ncbi:PH domain-containing protein [Saccharopolyspora gloriosae]|uniref:PH domain-containing protein n=1 Tax=Saccharopolyspora gloriosae TaxID=455344 RepID=UPI001FB56E1A|nr:PH domain-containing protein [Saccharopolyspora gloriosae]
MSESPAASERPGENDAEQETGRSGTDSAPAEPGAPDAADSERAEAEGTREVSKSEEHGTTGTATRDASDLPEETRADAAETAEATASAPNTAETPAAPAADKSSAGRAKSLPNSLTFQLTRTSLLAVMTVAICVTPIAFAQPFPLLLPSYLIPLALAYVITRPRTVVTAEHVTTRGLIGTTRFGWDELSSVRLNENRWVRAVLTSGKEVVLPAIRVRDLARLAELSGGRLPDPSAEPPQEDAAATTPQQPTDAEEPDRPENDRTTSETPETGTNPA